MGNCLNFFNSKKYKNIISKKNKLDRSKSRNPPENIAVEDAPHTESGGSHKNSINSLNYYDGKYTIFPLKMTQRYKEKQCERSVSTQNTKMKNDLQTLKKNISVSDIEIDNDMDSLKTILISITEDLKKDIVANFSEMKADLNNVIKDKLKMMQKINDERIKDKFETEVENKSNDQNIDNNLSINEKLENLCNEFNNLNKFIIELLEKIQENENERGLILKNNIEENYNKLIDLINNLKIKTNQNSEQRIYHDNPLMLNVPDSILQSNIYIDKIPFPNGFSQKGMDHDMLCPDNSPKNSFQKSKLNNLKPLRSINRPVFNKYV
jgi:hypothetical protein